MDSVLEILSQQAPAILLGISLAVAVLFVWVVRLAASESRQRARWRSLLEGTSGENLERLLFDHLKERVEVDGRVSDVLRRIEQLEGIGSTAKRHLGFVRYDAFEDVGGAQSFAFALFDDNGDGIVVNGIVGRTDCRVYCKPLVRGKSDRSLSPEETQAVSIAMQSVQREPVHS